MDIGLDAWEFLGVPELAALATLDVDDPLTAAFLGGTLDGIAEDTGHHPFLDALCRLLACSPPTHRDGALTAAHAAAREGAAVDDTTRAAFRAAATDTFVEICRRSGALADDNPEADRLDTAARWWDAARSLARP